MVQTTVPFLRSSIRHNLARRSGRLRMRFSLSEDIFQCCLAYDGDDEVFYHFYEVAIEGVDATELFAWATDNLLTAASQKLLITLCFDDGYAFETSLRPIFKKISRTTKVIVHHAESPEILWILLAFPYRESETTTAARWPLLRLREMVVYGINHDWRCLLGMVKCRWEDGGLETPFRLKLRYSNADDEVMEDIEDVIGEGRVSQGMSDSGSEPGSDIWEEW
ncbi:hypothetical protein FS837_009323 [Tulasnella sp. UAMH 9824]|nr:hypothetical protein FS837_009323 [Tulasnella sp. UAMH 9824]